MGAAGWQRQEQRHQEDLQRLRGFRPIDDTFMRGLFKENIPLAEFVLRIIIGARKGFLFSEGQIYSIIKEKERRVYPISRFQRL